MCVRFALGAMFYVFVFEVAWLISRVTHILKTFVDVAHAQHWYLFVFVWF